MSKELTLEELARIVGGVPVGDPRLCIMGAAAVENAGPGDITFAESAKILEVATQGRAGAVITKHGEDLKTKPGILVENPRFAFAKTLEIFAPDIPRPPEGIHKESVVAESAIIGKGVRIGPKVVIEDRAVLGEGVILYPGVYIGEDVKIGDGTVIYPNAVIRERVSIGRDVIIHGGAIIGACGFGFVTYENEHHKIPQTGTVIVEDDVEIGANTCIDRATMGATIIGKGTKIDNLVQIGHNVRIGDRCIIVAQTGIGGSSEIGEGTILAGQVGISDHVTIGPGSLVAGGAEVFTNLPPGSFVSGRPARPHKEQLKIEAASRKLPDVLEKLRELERRLNEMERSG
ncbi:MAG: UDP-3-O-(3-hydroxymyristoyl)glucosamine N-acyltransferase [Firmicutes bacterium]|nr:UDP-3-O-(3-hydroxymyristoyl)glucosamine N-acyltransferase [Bacillota bacterium]